MRRFLLLAPLALSIALAASPAGAASTTAATSVNVIKPVVLSKLQDLDFGTLTFSSFTGTRTVSLSRVGTITCAVDIVCSGATKAARFNVQGTNNKVVLITVTGGSLSNGTETIPFTPDAPNSITLTSSGVPGNNFEVGGSINVEGTLVGGVYAGTITVTTNYQ
jgi:spore coat protein U-like protein